MSAHKIPIEERFYSKIDTTGECWEWTAAKFPNGYAKLWDGQKSVGAHRISFELHVQPIPEGMFVMHRCDNPGCVNPAHLSIGTHSDNMVDAVTKGRLDTRRNVKLSPDAVADIRKRYVPGKVTHKQLAEEHGVSRACVQHVLIRKTHAR